MLSKVVVIKALDSQGAVVARRELTEIVFHKNETMAVLPSKVLKSMMAVVEKGGAIFIEKVWTT